MWSVRGPYREFWIITGICVYTVSQDGAFGVSRMLPGSMSAQSGDRIYRIARWSFWRLKDAFSGSMSAHSGDRKTELSGGCRLQMDSEILGRFVHNYRGPWGLCYCGMHPLVGAFGRRGQLRAWVCRCKSAKLGGSQH